MDQKIIIGIDPGLEGCITKLDYKSGDILDQKKMPTRIQKTVWKVHRRGKEKGKKYKSDIREIDRLGLRKYLFPSREDLLRSYIILEYQQTMPDQGISSSGKTMFNYGLLVGLCLGLLKMRYREVSPRSWRNYFHLKSGKDQSIQKAQELSGESFIPEGCQSPDHNLCDSYLIAEYGRQLI